MCVYVLLCDFWGSVRLGGLPAEAAGLSVSAPVIPAWLPGDQTTSKAQRRERHSQAGFGRMRAKERSLSHREKVISRTSKGPSGREEHIAATSPSWPQDGPSRWRTLITVRDDTKHVALLCDRRIADSSPLR